MRSSTWIIFNSTAIRSLNSMTSKCVVLWHAVPAVSVCCWSHDSCSLAVRSPAATSTCWWSAVTWISTPGCATASPSTLWTGSATGGTCWRQCTPSTNTVTLEPTRLLYTPKHPLMTYNEKRAVQLKRHYNILNRISRMLEITSFDLCWLLITELGD